LAEPVFGAALIGLRLQPAEPLASAVSKAKHLHRRHGWRPGVTALTDKDIPRLFGLLNEERAGTASKASSSWWPPLCGAACAPIAAASTSA
jgi:hypothetical protein